jgi:hypothetical protein
MSWFGARRVTTAAVVDVAADSVGGACIVLPEGEPALIAYAERAPIAPRAGEPEGAALLRALSSACELLGRAGGPALARAAGSGAPGKIIAVVGAPFEEPRLRIERLHAEDGSFLFDQSVLKAAMRRASRESPAKVIVDEAMVAAFLDGYRIRSPWGRSARRASIVLLSSSIDSAIAAPLGEALRKTYHTRDIKIASGALAFCRALEILFPHEGDYIAVVARGGTASLILIREGVFYALTTARLVHDLPGALLAALRELATQSPLPHALFIVAKAEEREALKAAFADARFAALWLSDEPPRLLPVLPEHLQLSGKLKVAGDAPADLFLGLLALFCAQPEERVP